jgi:hypothetical protein
MMTPFFLYQFGKIGTFYLMYGFLDSLDGVLYDLWYLRVGWGFFGISFFYFYFYLLFIIYFLFLRGCKSFSCRLLYRKF